MICMQLELCIQVELNVKYARNYLILNRQKFCPKKFMIISRLLFVLNFMVYPKFINPMSPCSPSVASEGLPTYKVAKYLAEILKPLVGKSEHHVVNSKEFVTKIE